MRRSLALLVGAGFVAWPTWSSAQDNCPEGDWLCEETPPEPPADDAAAPSPSTEPPLDEGEPAAPTADAANDTSESNTAARDTQVVLVERTPREPTQRKPRKQREWGFNLRLEGALIDDGDGDHDPGMGGLGFSFRYRPIPHFAFDFGLDFLGGTDYDGYTRNETVLPLTGIVFFNPRDLVQIYLPAGFFFSRARVEIEPRAGEAAFEPFRERYSYFGAHLGFGLEFRVGKKTALNLDLLGFIRGRTDDDAERNPEFVDPETGVATNTSGGGLLRAGITFYW